MGQKKARPRAVSCGDHSFASLALSPRHSDQASVREGNRSRHLLGSIARFETKASTLQGRDVTHTVRSNTKRLAQADDVKPQTPFLRNDVGSEPYPGCRLSGRLVGSHPSRNDQT